MHHSLINPLTSDGRTTKQSRAKQPTDERILVNTATDCSYERKSSGSTPPSFSLRQSTLAPSKYLSRSLNCTA